MYNIDRYMQAQTPPLHGHTLAARAGLHATAIYDIFAGRSRRPNIDTLERIAKALGVTIDDLMA